MPKRRPSRWLPAAHPPFRSHDSMSRSHWRTWLQPPPGQSTLTWPEYGLSSANAGNAAASDMHARANERIAVIVWPPDQSKWLREASLPPKRRPFPAVRFLRKNGAPGSRHAALEARCYLPEAADCTWMSFFTLCTPE